MISLSVAGPNAAQVPTDETNLCHQATRLLRRESGSVAGVAITLTKNIPPGSGLGGGSSDAAAVLRGVNQLWGLGLSDDLLELVGAELGSDVPFFIRGGLQLGEGVGDRLTVLKAGPISAVVLVFPAMKIDTGWAYGLFAGSQEFTRPPGFDALLAREPIPWTSFSNDFEEVIFPQHPELRTIKEALLEQGALHAGLSGSGSAVYGLFDKEPEVSTLPDMPLQSHVVVTHATVKS